MNDLVPSFEEETGQVILEGAAAGAAGEATLVPAPGLELAFDRADGHLCRVIVDRQTAAGPAAVGEQAAAVLTRLFGAAAASVVSAAAARPGEGLRLSPESAPCLALSRLARLDAARATSPVTCHSPWWAAEAADLAQRAELSARALAEARRAAGGLADAAASLALPGQAIATARAVARIAAADESDAAGRLRRNLDDARPGSPRPPSGPGLDVAAEVEGLEKDQVRLSGLHWVLDPGLVPAGLFRPGLSPHSDLTVRLADGEDCLIIEAVLAPGAECDALDQCRARLVDPELRRILARAPFDRAGDRARAELALPIPLDELKETWIEVVAGSSRPVRSARGHWTRRALRWADTALRAERHPAGLAPRSTGDDWAALAAVAWERCRRDWTSAGDEDRAFLAAVRLAGLDSRASVPEAPSATAAKLARRPPLPGPSCLAEIVRE